MLFVSPHPGYLITGALQKPIRDTSSGQITDWYGGVDVEFRHGGAPNWAAEQALENNRFQQLWGGLPDGVDHRLYIGSFDTEKAISDPELRAGVEEFLLNHVDNGTRFVLAEPPLAISGLPWPNYDKTHHFQVAKTAKEIGVALEDVLEYEKRNRARASVIEDLEKNIGDPVEVVSA